MAKKYKKCKIEISLYITNPCIIKQNEYWGILNF